ncbi:hypothetical protein GCM10023080_044330 [Streptomyces pseudoechinosporeus]
MGERAAHPPGEDNPSAGEQLRAEVDGLREEVARLRLRAEGRRPGGVGPAPGGTEDRADGAPVVRPSQGSPPGLGRGVSRRGLLIAGGAAVTVGGGAAVALLARGDGEDPKGVAPARSRAPAPAASRPPASIPARPRLRRLGTLKGHADGAHGLWFSPDGRTLVSSEADVGNLRLWDVASRKPLGAPLTSPYVNFLSAAVTPDGRTLITGGGDRTEFWSVPSRRPSGAPLTLSYDDAVFNVVALSPDGRTLATGGMGESDDIYGPGNGEVRLWDMASRRQVGQALTGHEGDLTGLVFSPDGKTLAVSSEVYEGTVRLWDVASRKPLGRPLRHEGGVTGMVFSPDGRTLASASGGVSNSGGVPGAVRFWDAATGAARGKPLRHDNWGINVLAYSGDGRTVTTIGAYETPRMRFWDAATHRERAEPLDPVWPDSATAFAPDGVTLAAENADGSISLWRIE